MPLKIPRYPRGTDPRDPSHLIHSSDERGAGPWQYRMTSAGAAGPLAFLSSGITLSASTSHPSDVFFRPDPMPPGIQDLYVFAFATGHFEPYSQPATRAWLIAVTVDLDESYANTIHQAAPDMLAVLPGLVLVHTGSGANNLPGPVILTPLPWDAV